MLDIYFEKSYVAESVYLFMNEEQIEREFLRIVESDSPSGPAFWDEDSLQMMKDYDGAVRDGDYGILLPEGKRCICALSLECQAALVVLYASRNYRKLSLRLNPGLIDLDTWVWLAEHTDFKLLIPLSLMEQEEYPDVVDMLFTLIRETDVALEGTEYFAGVEEGYMHLRKCVSEQFDWFYGLSPEAEANAFESYQKYHLRYTVMCYPKETLSMEQFLAYFDGAVTAKYREYPELFDFQVLNTCSSFDQGWENNVLLMYVVGKKGEHCELSLSSGIGKSTILHLLENCYVEYKNQYDQMYILMKPLLDEVRISSSIYDRELMGIFLDLQNQKLEFHHKDQAVFAFHEMQLNARRLERVKLYSL